MKALGVYQTEKDCVIMIAEVYILLNIKKKNIF